MTTRTLYKGKYSQKELDEISPERRVQVKILSNYTPSKYKVGDRVIIAGSPSPKINFYKGKEAIVKQVKNQLNYQSGYVDPYNEYKETYLHTQKNIEYKVVLLGDASKNISITLFIEEHGLIPK